MAVGAKTGGRKKGTPNKATAAKAAEIAASGGTPLDYMLKVMRDPGLEPDMRLDAAKSAAPYVHPKLAAIELTGKDGGPIQTESISDIEAARRMAFILQNGVKPSAGR